MGRLATGSSFWVAQTLGTSTRDLEAGYLALLAFPVALRSPQTGHATVERHQATTEVA